MNTRELTNLELLKIIIERIQADPRFSGVLNKLIAATDDELEAFINGSAITRVTDETLRFISSDHSLKLRSLNGSRLIYNAGDVFESIDPDFIKCGINNPGVVTPESSIQVHEVVKDSQPREIFAALSGNWHQKWLSQNQLIEFCVNFQQWLIKEGCCTFFLIKKDENSSIDEEHPEINLVTARVYIVPGGLDILLGSLTDADLWLGESRHRVVAPEFIPRAL